MRRPRRVACLLALCAEVMWSVEPMLAATHSARGKRPKQTTTPAVGTVAPPLALGLVLDASGTVTIFRTGWKKPMPACRNLPVAQGDKIRVGPSSHATALCLVDRQVFLWGPGQYSFTCKPPALSSADPLTSAYVNSRSVVSTHFVHGIAQEIPRGGPPQEWLARLLTTRPATWPTSISLKALVRVTEHDALREEINRMNISADAKLLVLADLDAASKLYDQAIDRLKSISTAARDPLVQIQLGDLFLASGDVIRARKRYQNATDLARQQGNPLAEAVAEQALGMIYVGEVKPSDAAPALRAAISRYRTVGEETTANQLYPILTHIGVRK